MSRPKYDSTVARIAGNIASGMVRDYLNDVNLTAPRLAKTVVTLARAIVDETVRTEPVPHKCESCGFVMRTGL